MCSSYGWPQQPSSSNLQARQQPSKGGSSEGHQGADAEREAVVEQGGVSLRGWTSRVLLSFLRVLLHVAQLEAAAKQQVQELGLRWNSVDTQAITKRFPGAASPLPTELLQDGPAVSYRSGVPRLKDMAVELGIGASRVVGHKGKLSVDGPGGGQRDPM